MSRATNLKRQLNNLLRRYQLASDKSLKAIQRQLHQTTTVEVPAKSIPISRKGLQNALELIEAKTGYSKLRRITEDYYLYKQLPSSSHAGKHAGAKHLSNMLSFYQGWVKETEAFLNALPADDDLDLTDELLEAIEGSIEGLNAFALSLSSLEKALGHFQADLPSNRGGNPRAEEENYFGNFLSRLASFYEETTGKIPTFGRDRITGKPTGKFYVFAKAVLLSVEPNPKHHFQYLETVISKIARGKKHTQK
jgi:hypothetical protein